MGRRQKEWAVRKRRELIARLGGKCYHCGSTERLEIDHIAGRDYCIVRMGSDSRVGRYARELEEGKLQVLCKPCNLKKH